MNAEASQRIRLRSGLSHAIERGEMHLHFQPQIDIASGNISGAEVLLRWDSGELGSVTPGDFIPVAEDSGLIIDIGAWVLLAACRQAESWRREGIFDQRIAVNVSILQFRRGNLEHQVTEALRISGLPPGMLELEVTESVLMQDQDRVIGTVERLTDLGVRISIDDFGTGYSSLSYLLRMRVGVLKIDKSFVQSALSHSGGSAVVRAVIEMAREIGAITIAEGVETREQLDFLKQCKCNGAQGYLIARPMPAADFGKFLATRSARRQRRSSGIAENI
jgi:EAL domain-containing protein (putative c-di-GMP-specific phosphodiesterase class I)